MQHIESGTSSSEMVSVKCVFPQGFSLVLLFLYLYDSPGSIINRSGFDYHISASIIQIYSLDFVEKNHMSFQLSALLRLKIE